MGKPSDFSKIRHLIFVENRENIVLPIPVPQLRSISLHLCASLWHPEHLCGNDRWNVFNNLQKTYIFSASSKISPILELKNFLLYQNSDVTRHRLYFPRSDRKLHFQFLFFCYLKTVFASAARFQAPERRQRCGIDISHSWRKMNRTDFFGNYCAGILS